MGKIEFSDVELKVLKALCFDRMQELREKTWRLDDDELRSIYDARYERVMNIYYKIEEALEGKNESL